MRAAYELDAGHASSFQLVGECNTRTHHICCCSRLHAALPSPPAARKHSLASRPQGGTLTATRMPEAPVHDAIPALAQQRAQLQALEGHLLRQPARNRLRRKQHARRMQCRSRSSKPDLTQASIATLWQAALQPATSAAKTLNPSHTSTALLRTWLRALLPHMVSCTDTKNRPAPDGASCEDMGT